jgi:hypothetical protein
MAELSWAEDDEYRPGFYASLFTIGNRSAGHTCCGCFVENIFRDALRIQHDRFRRCEGSETDLPRTNGNLNLQTSFVNLRVLRGSGLCRVCERSETDLPGTKGNLNMQTSFMNLRVLRG